MKYKCFEDLYWDMYRKEYGDDEEFIARLSWRAI